MVAQEHERGGPDPTNRTVDTLLREIANFREIIDAKLGAIDQRFAGIDKATELLAKYPTEVDKAIAQVKVFLEERIDGNYRLKEQKFAAVAEQFASIDKAISAALQASTKQLDSMASNFGTAIGAINEKVDDGRNRIQALESRGAGRGDSLAWIIGSISAILALASLGALIASWSGP